MNVVLKVLVFFIVFCVILRFVAIAVGLFAVVAAIKVTQAVFAK